MLEKERDIEREMGPAEEILWRLDDSSPMMCIATCTVSGGLDKTHLRAGLDAAQRRHPNLRVKIEQQGKQKPRLLSGVGEIPIIDVPSDVPTEDWVAQQLVIKLDADNGPLMVIGFQRLSDDRSRIYLKIHHSISDGASTVFLLRDIVQASAQFAKEGTAQLAALGPLPYFRDRFPAETKGLKGLLRYLYVVFKLLFSIFSSGIPKFLKVQQNVPVAQRRLSILTKKFPEHVMERLIVKARQEQTTVHGALYAAIVLAAAKDIGDGEKVCVGCASSVDMRQKITPPAQDDVSYLVSVVGSPHVVSCNDALWPLAREIRFEAQKALERKMDYVLMPFPYRLHAWIVRRMGHQPDKIASYLEGAHNPPCIVLTNVGQIKIQLEHPPYKIEEMEFYANPSVLTPFGSLVSTLNNVMCWTLIGSVPVVSREQLERVFDDAQHYLLAAIDNA